MQSRTTQPSLLINIYSFSGKPMPLESHGVATSLAEAVKDARDYEDEYLYTLSDIGKLDLSSQFSEGFQQARDFDASVDAQIYELKEKRLSREIA